MKTKTYARIVDGAAIDVTIIDPTTIFHPVVAAQFVVVPDGTKTGATLNGKTWTPPETEISTDIPQ